MTETPSFAAALKIAQGEPFYSPKMKLDSVDRGSDCYIFEFSVAGDLYGGGWAIVEDNGDTDFTQIPPSELKGARHVWGDLTPIGQG